MQLEEDASGQARAPVQQKIQKSLYLFDSGVKKHEANRWKLITEADRERAHEPDRSDPPSPQRYSQSATGMTVATRVPFLNRWAAIKTNDIWVTPFE
jgi:hypothetical protein